MIETAVSGGSYLIVEAEISRLVISLDDFRSEAGSDEGRSLAFTDRVESSPLLSFLSDGLSEEARQTETATATATSVSGSLIVTEASSLPFLTSDDFRMENRETGGSDTLTLSLSVGLIGLVLLGLVLLVLVVFRRRREKPVPRDLASGSESGSESESGSGSGSELESQPSLSQWATTAANLTVDDVYTDSDSPSI
jgi:hypothetical protein